MTSPAAVGQHVVAVDVATVWSDPTAPRPVDAAAVADVPDLAAWAAALTLNERIELHGLTETQLLRGEPVIEVNDWGDWVRIAAPWQPSPDDARGYPGWVRRAHLAAAHQASEPLIGPNAVIAADRESILGFARRFLGVKYLWGGLSEHGIDCSGLVHLAFRQAGLVIPRDADPQYAAATPIPIGLEEPGDLYFFAKEDGYVYHVGLVSGLRRMLHAPEASQLVEDTALSGRRLADLVAVGRLLPADPTR